MTATQKIKLAYKTAQRLHLLPLLDEEINSIFFCLDLVREEDIVHLDKKIEI